MAEGKKSFVAYSDWKETFDALDDDVAGQLIKHIFSYVNDEKPISNNPIIKAVFPNIKNTLKRDLEKWDNQLIQRSLAGKKSAELRATKSNERSTVVHETVRNPTDSVSVSVSDNVNDIIILKAKPLTLDNDFDLFWKKYNKKIDSKKCKDKFKKLSKIQVETILKVIDSYVAATSDVQYRKNPLTWLNGECWKDVEVNTFLPTKDKPFGKSNQL
jgi:hypothetical protein